MTSSEQAAASSPAFHSQYRVVIVGAGLVGLLLAIVLRRADYHVVVIDKDSKLKEIGAGIILPANACRALAQANVLDKVKSCAVAPNAWVSHSYQQGGILSRMELDPYIQDQYNVPFLVIHRPDLRRILFEEAKARGACIHLATTADVHRTDFSDDLIHATVTDDVEMVARNPDDGRKERTLQADLVIAAEGQQSEARAFLAGHSNQPLPTGKMVNRILIGIDRMRELGLEDLIDPPCIHVWLGPGSMAVGYLLKDVFNFVLVCSSECEPEVYLGPREVEKEELRAVFQDWDPRIRSLVENGHGYLKWLLLENGDTALSSWIHAAEGDKLKLALIGDAAHAIGPYIGSGAALGFESATVLGALLEQARQQSDIAPMLSVYESLRRPRTDLVKRVTQKMGQEWMLPDGPLQAARDRTFVEEVPPSQGYPNALQDPFFQTWLYSFDGEQEAREAWRLHREDSVDCA
ncbi:MAG: hypothetical protein LQ337_007334 [Flavoplaca oasis]|nr:MAG: hypothetical protein LQ337_007334 [Flavoplaca oasis]